MVGAWKTESRLMPHPSQSLVIIMAHREAEATCRRHLPLWQSHNCDMIFYCPLNSIVNVGYPVLAHGLASHHDTMANERFLKLLCLLEKTIYNQFIIYEYDAMSLRSDLSSFRKPDVLYGNVFRDNRPEREFIGTTFVHPPLIFGRTALRRMLDVQISPSLEHGFWDRLLGLMIERAEIQTFDFLAAGHGFARNTIEPPEYATARNAARAGAYLFHGVKTEECLNHLRL